MVLFIAYTIPAVFTARLVIKAVKSHRMKIQAGKKLEDGSTVLACALCSVDKRSEGWRVVPKQVRVLAGVRNAGHALKRNTIGKETRLFVAVESPSGEIVMMLLKTKTLFNKEVDIDLTDPKSVQKCVDTSFSISMNTKPATLERTRIEMSEDGMVFRLSPDDNAKNCARTSFELTFFEDVKEVDDINDENSVKFNSEATSLTKPAAAEWLAQCYKSQQLHVNDAVGVPLK